MKNLRGKSEYSISKKIDIENIQIEFDSLIVSGNTLSIDYTASRGDEKIIIEDFFLLLEKAGDWNIFLPEEWDHYILRKGFSTIVSDNVDMPFDSLIIVIVNVSVYSDLQDSFRSKKYQYEKTDGKESLDHLLSAIVNRIRKLSEDAIYITKPVVLVNSFNKYFSSEKIKQVFLENFFEMLANELFWKEIGNLSTFLASPCFLYNSLLDYFASGDNQKLILAEPGPFLDNDSEKQEWIIERKNEISKIINSESKAGSIKSGDCLYHLMEYIEFIFRLRESIKDDYLLNRDRHNPVATATVIFTKCDEDTAEKIKIPLFTNEQIQEFIKQQRYEEIKHHIHIQSIEHIWNATAENILRMSEGQVIALKKKSIQVDSIDWE